MLEFSKASLVSLMAESNIKIVKNPIINTNITLKSLSALLNYIKKMFGCVQKDPSCLENVV